MLPDLVRGHYALLYEQTDIVHRRHCPDWFIIFLACKQFVKLQVLDATVGFKDRCVRFTDICPIWKVESCGLMLSACKNGRVLPNA